MQNLNHQFHQLREAIGECVERHLVTPSLILIYTTIDVCAWLEYDDAQVGTRFQKWCDSHLLPESEVKATGIDLYGARCGVLHSLSAESKKSDSGVARQVIYGWGIADHSKLQKITDGAGVRGFVAVQLEHLRDALFSAMDKLALRAQNSPRIAGKVRKWLAHQSIEDTDALYEIVRASKKDV